MAQCTQCGNDYDKTFEVIMGGQSYIFDSFECAINSLAPVCQHCGSRIIGHGIESSGVFYCCANCAAQEGVKGVRDRQEQGVSGRA